MNRAAWAAALPLQTLPDWPGWLRALVLLLALLLSGLGSAALILPHAIQTGQTERQTSQRLRLQQSSLDNIRPKLLAITPGSTMPAITLPCQSARIRQLARQHALVLLLSVPVSMDPPSSTGLTEQSANLLLSGHYDDLRAFAISLQQANLPLLLDQLKLSRAPAHKVDLAARMRCLLPAGEDLP